MSTRLNNCSPGPTRNGRCGLNHCRKDFGRAKLTWPRKFTRLSQTNIPWGMATFADPDGNKFA